MAAYSSLDLTELKALAVQYGVRFNRAEQVKGGMANTSYLLDDSHILSVLNNHDEASANELAGIVAHVSSHGVETPELIERLEGGTVTSAGATPVILRPFIPGIPLSERPDQRPADIGELLAKIHTVPPLSGFRSRLRRIPASWRNDLAGHSCADLVAAIETAEAFEASGAFERDAFVFTHGDLFPDNIIERPDGSLVPIDWEAAAMDSALFDLGITLVTAASAKDGFSDARVGTMIDGYRRMRVFDWDDELILKAGKYATAMLAFSRFMRHHIRFPNPAMHDSYKEMLAFAR
ncbi:MAG: phosphotransferase [Parvibaculum sp.]|uniref:phosphotransferase enzyme family protein n=1 Tax=Parvibaculum sp. TaxID=2024848 RepID=UPI003C713D83